MRCDDKVTRAPIGVNNHFGSQTNGQTKTQGSQNDSIPAKAMVPAAKTHRAKLASLAGERRSGMWQLESPRITAMVRAAP